MRKSLNATNLRVELLSISDYTHFPIDLLNKRLGIDSSFLEVEIENLLRTNYKTKYSYPILSYVYPDRDWKDNFYHEDHIFPKSFFTPAKLRSRGYDEARIIEYRQYYNTVLNLQLLTDSENLEKKATDFDQWIGTRDSNFKNRHNIPILPSYNFDDFINFIEERKKSLKAMLISI